MLWIAELILTSPIRRWGASERLLQTFTDSLWACGSRAPSESRRTALTARRLAVSAGDRRAMGRQPNKEIAKIFAACGNGADGAELKDAWEKGGRPTTFKNVQRAYNVHLEAQASVAPVRATTPAKPAAAAYFARLDETGLTTIKESGKMTVFSVPTAALANRMQSLGYVRVSCVYMTDDTQLPPRIARTTGAGSSREHRSKAPPGVVVPPALPAVDGVRETAAQQLVREWELHVELEDKYYSPCYLWSQYLRDQEPKLNKDHFNQRAKAYVYLKRATTPRVSAPSARRWAI